MLRLRELLGRRKCSTSMQLGGVFAYRPPLGDTEWPRIPYLPSYLDRFRATPSLPSWPTSYALASWYENTGTDRLAAKSTTSSLTKDGWFYLFINVVNGLTDSLKQS